MIEGEGVENDWGLVGIETQGQYMLRNEVAFLAERWNWSRESVLGMTVMARKAYVYRVHKRYEKEEEASKRK